MLNHKNMHIQKPFPCEKYVTNTTVKSLPPRFSSPLPFLLFAQPWPPFFLSETETKLYWVQSETKTIYSPFHNLENAIWKNSLDSFLLWFSWCDHFACQILTGIFVLFTELPQIRRRLLTDPSHLNVFHFRFSLANQTSSTSSLVITFVPQMSSDWFN